MAELKEARVPDIGGYDGVPVIELLVAVGDTVEQDQGLVTLESDKATMEVPAPFAGIVRELKVKLGDSLAEGSVVALIEPSEAERRRARRRAATARSPRRAAPQAKVAETALPVEPVAVAAAPDKLAQRSIESAAGASSAHATIEGAMPHSDPEAMPPRTPPVRLQRR